MLFLAAIVASKLSPWWLLVLPIFGTLTLSNHGNFARYRIGRIWRIHRKLVASGSYPGSNGEVLSFALQGLPQSNRNRNAKPLFVNIRGAGAYSYRYLPGTGRDDGKVTMRDGAGVEHTTAAYNAAVTGDDIIVVAEFDA